MTAAVQYWGKYRGTVINNIDPMMQGRILAMVPAVSSAMLTSWALPCFPVAGIKTGMFAVPIIGSNVWIEFENGDPDYPIWAGCFYGMSSSVPSMAKAVPPVIPGITFQTPLKNGLSINDVPGPKGGIVLKTGTGVSLIVNDTGIYINNGKGASLTLVGTTVTINKGALSVT
ncbi:MAG: hypothetical protein QOJ53_2422 [Sphingomonadales bacterium]|jgi:uncharacterized protein involved in type VI secretion and phage assembly|nr:hypothetical protein [Sphingomonadales bacterium]MEA3043919.1 hypothetical protein [Sphingomonadales bacterium]MEA3048090.1 hypothetical protein [Sphingomonadales bacterium]